MSEERATEMEIRVAKALADYDLGDEAPGTLLLGKARAAIRALAVPDEDMAHAAVRLGLADDIDCGLIYRAMIEAATASPSPSKEHGVVDRFAPENQCRHGTPYADLCRECVREERE